MHEQDLAASMGPRSADRGIYLSGYLTESTQNASMGPRSADRGIKMNGKGYIGFTSSFNGAAIS